MFRLPHFFTPLFFAILAMCHSSVYAQETLKIGVVGLTHTHVHWIFESEKRGEIEIVGIVESNKALAKRYAAQHSYSMNKVYQSMDELFAQQSVDAVTAFGRFGRGEKCRTQRHSCDGRKTLGYQYGSRSANV